MAEYRTVVGDLQKGFEALRPYLEARSLFIEWFYYGPELLRWADGVGDILTLAADKSASDSAFSARAAEVLAEAEAFYADYDGDVIARSSRRYSRSTWPRCPTGLRRLWPRKPGRLQAQAGRRPMRSTTRPCWMKARPSWPCSAQETARR